MIAVAVAVVCAATGARALDPPPAASYAALVADVARALGEARRVAALLGVEAPVARADSACAALLASSGSCAAAPDDGCFAALVATYDVLRGLRVSVTTAPASASTSRRVAAADALASELFGVASRLAVARDAVARGRCDDVAAIGTHPTQMLLGADARSVLVRPLTALRAGRRYAVVARGVSAEVMAALRRSVVPKPEGERDDVAGGDDGSGGDVGTVGGGTGRGGGRGIDVPSGAFAGEVAKLLPDDAGGVSTASTQALIERLERDADAMPGLGAFAGVRVTLPEPVAGKQIGTLQLAFATLARAKPDEIVTVLRIADPRKELLADRARLATLSCSETKPVERDVAEVLGQPVSQIAHLVQGEYRSLALADDAARAPLGDASSTTQPVSLPYLLALPADARADTPLVVLLDGHAGSAARILSRIGGALAGRGLALLALELPLHGQRAVQGQELLDAHDPAAFGRRVRQATVDVLAAVEAAVRCGLPLSSGERLAATDVRYLGYSLGAMVGSIARSVEPRLGTTVLVAPGADVFGWLLLRVGPSLGATYVTCLGGPQDGESCIPGGECAPPGVCIVDPYLERLQWLLTLPYQQAALAADPLSYVTQRTGAFASHGRLLLITGGEDVVLHPALATKLADAYRLRPIAKHRRRGPRAQMVQWPALGHELFDRAGVRAQIVEFLASDGRRLLLGEEPAATSAPGWYRVYGPSRK